MSQLICDGCDALPGYNVLEDPQAAMTIIGTPAGRLDDLTHVLLRVPPLLPCVLVVSPAQKHKRSQSHCVPLVLPIMTTWR